MAMPAQKLDNSEWLTAVNDDELVTEWVYQRYLELSAMEEALAERRDSLPWRDLD